MANRIAPRRHHHSQRFANHAGGVCDLSMDWSHKFGEGERRASNNRVTIKRVPTSTIMATALGLTAASHRINAMAMSAKLSRPTISAGEGVLRLTITTTEMREKAPANTIGFSRLAGRKWTCASARMDFARVNGMERIASQRQASAARGLAFGHNAAARNNT